MNSYISCPIPVSLSKLTEVAIKLGELGYPSLWWIRSTTYTDTKLREADIFVLMSQDNDFTYGVGEMTLGCKKELELAKSLNKPLYMAYWKGGKVLRIYPISKKNLEKDIVLGETGKYLRKSEIINNYEIY